MNVLVWTAVQLQIGDIFFGDGDRDLSLPFAVSLSDPISFGIQYLDLLHDSSLLSRLNYVHRLESMVTLVSATEVIEVLIPKEDGDFLDLAIAQRQELAGLFHFQ